MSSERPRRGEKSDHRPGAVIQAMKRTRRTKEQIEQDIANKNMEDKRKAAVAKAMHSTAIQRSAAKEDEIQSKELEARKYAARPDMLTLAAYKSQAKYRFDDGDDDEVVDENTKSGMDEDESLTLWDPVDIPPMSMAGTDSEGIDPDFEFDEDNEDEEANEEDELGMEVDEEWEKVIKARGERSKARAKKACPKKKDEREQFRAQIDSARKTVPTSTIVEATKIKPKRKASNAITPESNIANAPGPPPSGKRPKQAEVGGLKPNWKKEIGLGKKKPHATTKPRQSSPDDDQEDSANADFHGEFAMDEQPLVIAASRAAKTEVGPSRKKGTTSVGLKDLGTAKASHIITLYSQSNDMLRQMGVRLVNVKVEESSAGPNQREPAKRYVNANLPFANPTRDLKKWQTLVLSALTDWAGTLHDPFHANSHDDFRTIINENWAKVFGDRETNDAVYEMAAASLRNWRSNIGKRALKFYKQKFEQEPFKNSPEKIKLYVSQMMADMVVNGKGMGLKFIYADQETGNGAYRSEVIVDIFAIHLQVILKTDPELSYGKPSGALSLCCASAERGLLAWKDGTSPDDNFKSFVDKPWGLRAAAYLPGIQKLTDSKWDKLCNLAAEIIKVPGTMDVVDLTADDGDPRSQVLLSDDSD